MAEAAAEFATLGADRYAVRGDLGFGTVASLLAESRSPLASGTGAIEMDLSAVTASDSAGLALLIEWLRWADHAGRAIRFVRVPEQLQALARISDLDGILPFSG